jgi:hypothetical protein
VALVQPAISAPSTRAAMSLFSLLLSISSSPLKYTDCQPSHCRRSVTAWLLH